MHGTNLTAKITYARIMRASNILALFSFEDFQSADFCAFPALPSTADILYRGWMLSTEEYERLIAEASGVGARLAVDRAAYIANHHLPQWYD
jgi:hypothetical protein